MLSLSLLFTLGTSFLSSVGSIPTPELEGNWKAVGSLVKRTDVDDFIAKEQPIALEGVLANIGADGSKVSGALSGVVVASPSKQDPDYFYTWTRDAALVIKQFVEAYVHDPDGSDASTYQTKIEQYAEAQAKIQQIDNPSGGPDSGGLGEPKFYVNETAFTGSWGRPQRDGPALRAITLILYADQLVSDGNTSYVSDTLWPIIQKDLDYVVQYWDQSGFDLWEEVQGSSFFTTANQYRSLVQGAALAKSLDETDSYSDVSTKVLCTLQSYWSDDGFTIANLNQRSGKDANTILGSIHLFDAKAGCDATTFQPCSDKSLANLKVVVDSFRTIYKINDGIDANAAVAIGRYPEDTYYTGNPWYLTTLSAAEQIYDALYIWKDQKSVEVTDISLPFFQQFGSSIKAGTYESTDDTYTTIVDGAQALADGFVAVVQKYTPDSGALSEQFTKEDGTPTSASDLTWSYSSFLTMAQARVGQLPPSWGADGAESDCSGGGGETVEVTFEEEATTSSGENIFVTGSISALSNWDTDKAVALTAGDDSTWTVTVKLPASTSFEYKFIRKESDGSVQWEADPNRSASAPASGSTTIKTSWR